MKTTVHDTAKYAWGLQTAVTVDDDGRIHAFQVDGGRIGAEEKAIAMIPVKTAEPEDEKMTLEGEVELLKAQKEVLSAEIVTLAAQKEALIVKEV